MEVRQALAEAKTLLTEHLEDQNLNLDASLLLSIELGISREQLYARLSDPLEEGHFQGFMKLVEKRCQGYPLAYISGEKEFYGRVFKVHENVLCPRPDTETLVERALSLVKKNRNTPRIADICTGTGCIALTMEAETGIPVCSVDISPQAEFCFRENRQHLGLQSPFFTGNLLEPLKGKFDLILTNPPYVTTGETQERMDQGWKEPVLALDGGADGLDLVRILIDQAPEYMNNGAYLLIEADPRQMDEMARIMKQRGYSNIKTIDDLTQRPRVLEGQWND